MSTLRNRFLAALDPLARRLGAYTAYTIPWTEYVGSLDVGPRDARDYLLDHGYRPHALSAVKYHPEFGTLDDGSYRRVPDEHPIEVMGTALDSRYPGGCQYHVHVFRTPHGVDVFSHYELRPFTAPVRHYRPVKDSSDRPPEEWNYLEGVTDLELPR